MKKEPGFCMIGTSIQYLLIRIVHTLRDIFAQCPPNISFGEPVGFFDVSQRQCHPEVCPIRDRFQQLCQEVPFIIVKILVIGNLLSHAFNNQIDFCRNLICLLARLATQMDCG